MGFLNGGLVCLLNFNARIREFTIRSLELKEDDIYQSNYVLRLNREIKASSREVKSERCVGNVMHVCKHAYKHHKVAGSLLACRTQGPVIQTIWTFNA